MVVQVEPNYPWTHVEPNSAQSEASKGNWRYAPLEAFLRPTKAMHALGIAILAKNSQLPKRSCFFWPEWPFWILQRLHAAARSLRRSSRQNLGSGEMKSHILRLAKSVYKHAQLQKGLKSPPHPTRAVLRSVSGGGGREKSTGLISRRFFYPQEFCKWSAADRNTPPVHVGLVQRRNLTESKGALTLKLLLGTIYNH